MKKYITLVFIILFFTGCGAEFYKHDSMYSDFNHLKFSWWGYKKPTAEDAKLSEQRGWWGEEIPYIPAE